MTNKIFNKFNFSSFILFLPPQQIQLLISWLFLYPTLLSFFRFFLSSSFSLKLTTTSLLSMFSLPWFTYSKIIFLLLYPLESIVYVNSIISHILLELILFKFISLILLPGQQLLRRVILGQSLIHSFPYSFYLLCAFVSMRRRWLTIFITQIISLLFLYHFLPELFQALWKPLSFLGPLTTLWTVFLLNLPFILIWWIRWGGLAVFVTHVISFK